jgi:hypothetical protein
VGPTGEAAATDPACAELGGCARPKPDAFVDTGGGNRDDEPTTSANSPGTPGDTPNLAGVSDGDSRGGGDSGKRADCKLSDGNKTGKEQTTGGNTGSVGSSRSSGAGSVGPLSGQRCPAPIETG